MFIVLIFFVIIKRLKLYISNIINYKIFNNCEKFDILLILILYCYIYYLYLLYYYIYYLYLYYIIIYIINFLLYCINLLEFESFFHP